MNDKLTNEKYIPLDQNNNKGKILIIASVEAEKEAILRGMQLSNIFDVVVSGVGIAAAAAKTARQLANQKYELVINAGVAGGFVGLAKVGSIVVATEVIAAELGTETLDGFSSIDELGFGTNRYNVDNHLVLNIAKAFSDAGQEVTIGPILSVSTVTGTEETTLELKRRIPGATAEAMEGFGVATAAKQFDIPMLEIRTISNVVGPRDRDSWRMKEALQKLQEISSILQEVLT